jgi:hypothetical protein
MSEKNIIATINGASASYVIWNHHPNTKQVKDVYNEFIALNYKLLDLEFVNGKLDGVPLEYFTQIAKNYDVPSGQKPPTNKRLYFQSANQVTIANPDDGTITLPAGQYNIFSVSWFANGAEGTNGFQRFYVLQKPPHIPEAFKNVKTQKMGRNTIFSSGMSRLRTKLRFLNTKNFQATTTGATTGADYIQLKKLRALSK